MADQSALKAQKNSPSPLDEYLRGNHVLDGPAVSHAVTPAAVRPANPVYIPSEIRVRIRDPKLRQKLQELAEPGESARDLVERILKELVG